MPRFGLGYSGSETQFTEFFVIFIHIRPNILEMSGLGFLLELALETNITYISDITKPGQVMNIFGYSLP
jgi:hypothetical protein